jgi:hypothetical protein
LLAELKATSQLSEKGIKKSFAKNIKYDTEKKLKVHFAAFPEIIYYLTNL